MKRIKRITVLGSGTSNGVPHIWCMMEDFAHCPTDVCRKAARDPRHRRTRASVLLETVDGCFLLVDTSADFREQALKNRIKKIDSILYTHAHADHILGLPDMRPYSHRQNGPLDVYGSAETMEELSRIFRYIFNPPETHIYATRVSPHVLEKNSTEEVLGLEVTPILVEHAGLAGCFGYRIDDVAYIPDVHEFPPGELDKLHDLDVLIVNALRKRPHSRHMHLEKSMEIAEELRPRRCYFTHMTHDIDYELDGPNLPEWMDFAYDDLQIEL